MTSAATLKHRAIEDAITTAFTGLAGGWSVYEHPADVLSLPACVIGPGSPYREPTTYGAMGTNMERVRLRVHLLVRRDADKALFAANEAADRVMTAADAVSGYSTAWSAMDAQGMVDVNGIEAFGFTMEASVV